MAWLLFKHKPPAVQCTALSAPALYPLNSPSRRLMSALPRPLPLNPVCRGGSQRSLCVWKTRPFRAQRRKVRGCRAKAWACLIVICTRPTERVRNCTNTESDGILNISSQNPTAAATGSAWQKSERNPKGARGDTECASSSESSGTTQQQQQQAETNDRWSCVYGTKVLPEHR